MTRLYQRGLVVGKFAPLHRGHELVIRTAMDQCHEVVVISYSNPELPECGPERRALWLGALFPSTRRLVVTDQMLRTHADATGTTPIAIPANDADAASHRRFVGLLCSEILRTTVDAVFTSEEYGDGFASDLGGFLRLRAPGAAPVVHVSVDAARSACPISGTMLRADVHAQRRWLSPDVYRSFVGRVAVLGGESSGKTTLAQELAATCDTRWVAEYGRTLWEQRNGALQFEDLLTIARTQVAAEETATPLARQWLFCDTSPLTTLFYSEAMFDRAAPELEALADRPYQVTVLCAPDFPFVQDGTRRDDTFRLRQHQWYRQQLQRRGVPFIEAAGTLATRTATVLAALEARGASDHPTAGDSAPSR